MKILVGTDRSETATRAVEWAAEMARRYEAELVAVQVGGDRSALEQYLAKVAPGARALVVEGEEPAAAIVAASESERADVLVVGNVGMSGRKEFLLGNIPNRVSHNARCTVVIVNTAETGGSRLPWRRK
ncbi:MAG TPA: universal stress protein [Gaiellaceae bacterium]|nr:universal stress protein [Gaiellaceae bacterium]